LALKLEKKMKPLNPKITAVNLSQMYNMSRYVLSKKENTLVRLLLPAQFLYKEIPQRLQQLVLVLNQFQDHLPEKDRLDLNKVSQRYNDDLSLFSKIQCPKKTSEETTFSEILKIVKRRRSKSYIYFWNFLKQLHSEGCEDWDLNQQNEIERIMGIMMNLTIGMNLLIDQHLSLKYNRTSLVEKFNPIELVEQSLEQGDHPQDTFIKLKNFSESSTELLWFPQYFKKALKYLLISPYPTSEKRSLSLVTLKGKEDFCLKVEDNKDGISLNQLSQWNSWIQEKPWIFHRLKIMEHLVQYFGGDLKMASMDGHATNLYFYLPLSGTVPERICPVTSFSKLTPFNTPIKLSEADLPKVPSQSPLNQLVS